MCTGQCGFCTGECEGPCATCGHSWGDHQSKKECRAENERWAFRGKRDADRGYVHLVEPCNCKGFVREDSLESLLERSIEIAKEAKKSA